jgi:hypothetical protein
MAGDVPIAEQHDDAQKPVPFRTAGRACGPSVRQVFAQSQIRLNQVGFHPADAKVAAVIGGGTSFLVLSAEGTKTLYQVVVTMPAG